MSTVSQHPTFLSLDVKARRWHWVFGWTARFTESWGSLPAVPILYAMLFFGALHVTLTDPIPGGLGDVAFEPWASISWRVLSMVSPAIAWLAWWLIDRKRGNVRLFGLWLRFAGDIGQFIALASFLLSRAVTDRQEEYDDPHVYLTYALLGVLGFVGMLVLRDLWILIQVEEITRELEHQSEDPPPGDKKGT